MISEPNYSESIFQRFFYNFFIDIIIFKIICHKILMQHICITELCMNITELIMKDSLLLGSCVTFLMKV